MVTGSLARRYANALMQIGAEDGNYERIGREVAKIASALSSSPDLITVLTNPAFTQTERARIMDALLARLGASKVVINFVSLLLDRDRMSALPAIARELDNMIDERAGRVSAVITSATPLSPAEKQQLVATLERLSGKKVTAQTREDPELLGGVVCKLGDVVYDGSLRTQLNSMRQGLVK